LRNDPKCSFLIHIENSKEEGHFVSLEAGGRPYDLGCRIIHHVFFSYDYLLYFEALQVYIRECFLIFLSSSIFLFFLFYPQPNCYSRMISVRGTEHIIIFAKRDINQWEELTYDYRWGLHSFVLIF
jgi:SET domain